MKIIRVESNLKHLIETDDGRFYFISSFTRLTGGEKFDAETSVFECDKYGEVFDYENPAYVKYSKTRVGMLNNHNEIVRNIEEIVKC